MGLRDTCWRPMNRLGGRETRALRCLRILGQASSPATAVTSRQAPLPASPRTPARNEHAIREAPAACRVAGGASRPDRACRLTAKST
jgi:hypothetical protein